MNTRIIAPALAAAGLLAILVPARAEVIWERTYGGPGGDQCQAVIRTSDGGFLLGGSTAPEGGGPEDILLIKIDGDGDIQWQYTYGGAARDLCFDVIETVAGDFVVAGQTGVPPYYYDGLLLRVDSGGTELWQESYGGSSRELFRAVYETGAGDLIVAGDTESFGAGGVYLVRADGDGVMRWQKGLGEAADHAYGVAKSGDGGIVIGGYRSDGSLAPEIDVLLIKADANGNRIFAKTYGDGVSDYVYGMMTIAPGEFLLLGDASGLAAGWKIDKFGDLHWERTWADDRALAAVPDGEGGFLICASYYDQDIDKEFEYLVIHADSDGMATRVDSIGGADWDIASDIAAAPDGDFVVVGSSRSFGGGDYDWYAVRGNDAGSTPSAIRGTPAVDLALTAAPNPFNPRTRIAFTLPGPGRARLVVYDVAGRRVITLLDRRLPAGPARVDWNGRGASGRPVPSGVYFARLDALGETGVYKLVVAK